MMRRIARPKSRELPGHSASENVHPEFENSTGMRSEAVPLLSTLPPKSPRRLGKKRGKEIYLPNRKTEASRAPVLQTRSTPRKVKKAGKVKRASLSCRRLKQSTGPESKQPSYSNAHNTGSERHAISLYSIKNSLAQLQEYFSCTLCLDVIAHPYILTPIQCGHTFCALCILKWFFAGLHDECGSWHRAVRCPLCRCKLTIPPEPRSLKHMPFAPNRLANTLITDIITQKLYKIHKLPEEDGDYAREDQTCILQKSNMWAEGGKLRKDWLARVREGKGFMDELAQNWISMSYSDFTAFKIRLNRVNYGELTQ